jgi:hypothetical protein
MSIRLEDFKNTKRELKGVNGQLSELFEEFEDERMIGNQNSSHHHL